MRIPGADGGGFGLSVVLLLVAGVGVPVSVMRLHDPVAGPVAELPATPGPRLVTAYAADQKWYVIDPAAGRYRQVDGGGVASVSPDLRLYTDLATLDGTTSLLRITPTSGAGPDQYHKIAGDAIAPVWSPDGTWLALPVFEPPADGLKPEHGFTELVLVDVRAGTMQRRKIRIGDRYGDWAGWADNDTLLVGTDGADAEQEAGVAVVRRDGRMLSWHPLPVGDPCEAPPRAAPPSHGGEVLSCTQDRSHQIYRVFDPRRGTTGPELGRIPLSPDRRAEPVFWQSDDVLVLQLFDLVGDRDFADVRVARLSTAQIEAAPPRGVPKEPNQALVGSSDGLSAAGAKLTF
jgi:hypothetical protein